MQMVSTRNSSMESIRTELVTLIAKIFTEVIPRFSEKPSVSISKGTGKGPGYFNSSEVTGIHECR